MSAPGVGDRVRFAPNPRFKAATVDGKVVRRRASPNTVRSGLRRAIAATKATRGAVAGWLDVLCDDGATRSARPSQAQILPPENLEFDEGGES